MIQNYIHEWYCDYLHIHLSPEIENNFQDVLKKLYYEVVKRKALCPKAYKFLHESGILRILRLKHILSNKGNLGLCSSNIITSDNHFWERERHRVNQLKDIIKKH